MQHRKRRALYFKETSPLRCTSYYHWQNTAKGKSWREYWVSWLPISIPAAGHRVANFPAIFVVCGKQRKGGRQYDTKLFSRLFGLPATPTARNVSRHSYCIEWQGHQSELKNRPVNIMKTRLSTRIEMLSCFRHKSRMTIIIIISSLPTNNFCAYLTLLPKENNCL